MEGEGEWITKEEWITEGEGERITEGEGEKITEGEGKHKNRKE